MTAVEQARHPLVGEGDHAMDGALRARDNAAVRAYERAKSKIESRVPHWHNRESQTNGNVDSFRLPNGYGKAPAITAGGGDVEIMCGPLLNYKHMSNVQSTSPTWHGSVLIVTSPDQPLPELTLRSIGSVADQAGHPDGMVNGNGAAHMNAHAQEGDRRFKGEMLYSDPAKSFWRFKIDLPLRESEWRWEYSILRAKFIKGASPAAISNRSFAVPAASQSMRIMFHSCNGFSVGTDEEAWSGPVLWNDVLRVHEAKPFHVMIGGGDQIYNDGVRVAGPLRSWTEIGNPKKRRDYPFKEELRAACDEFYFKNYVRWFSTEPFASANAEIPQINIWDDHDIIDGFGSYTDNFMRCAVFRGIGGVSFKYYCLFQHHIPPPKSTFTTDAPQTAHGTGIEGPGADPAQLRDTFVAKEETQDQSFILGNRPGPYIEEVSRSLYTQLGARIAFVGIDARTERTRHQVNYPDTYDLIFQRVRSGLTASPDVKHLIVLLGVPIAYPRLAWLENLFTSPLIAPIRLLNKRFGLAGGLFNHFDGQVDLLDDLDDHYTARQHKDERRQLIVRLQELSHAHNVRVTILGGDVHLAAVGRFYSNLSLEVPAAHDHRYMANVVSSAITNKPPPKAIANLLARRNKIHHLDQATDETLMVTFDEDPGKEEKTAASNHVTMPSRNYAILTETESSLQSVDGEVRGNGQAPPLSQAPKSGHQPLHAGEEGAGSKHAAASGLHAGVFPGGLDVSIRVEINQHDREGRTQGYGFSIPPLSIAH